MDNSEFNHYLPTKKPHPAEAFGKPLPFNIETENFKLRGILTSVLKKGTAGRDCSPIQDLTGLGNKHALAAIFRALGHDLNNQLSAIQGNLDLVIESCEADSELYEMLLTARTSAHTAIEISQKIHDASGGYVEKKECLDISGIIMGIVHNINRTHAAIVQYITDGEIVRVPGYGFQIEEALSQIIHYCAEYVGEKGCLNVKVSCGSMDKSSHHPIESGKYVQIAISEAGEHSSDSLSPADLKDERLSIAREIIEEHEGIITMASPDKAGISLNVYLKTADSAIKERRSDSIGINRQGRILFMDDRGEVRKVVFNILARLGYESECVEDGFQAIQRYQQAQNSGRPFDAVILDLNVPGGLGARETIVELQKIDPNVRALVCSGYHNSAIMTNHEKFGFCGYVAKPFTLDEFSRVIHDAIFKINSPSGQRESRQLV